MRTATRTQLTEVLRRVHSTEARGKGGAEMTCTHARIRRVNHPAKTPALYECPGCDLVFTVPTHREFNMVLYPVVWRCPVCEQGVNPRFVLDHFRKGECGTE